MNLRSGGTESENKWIGWVFPILELGLFIKRQIKEDDVTYFTEATSSLQLLKRTSWWKSNDTLARPVG